MTSMETASRSRAGGVGRGDVHRAARVVGLWGLVARGVLYVLLALLAFDLVTQGSRKQVDARGALHQLAHDPFGSVVLVVVAVGFAGFACWHLYVAVFEDRGTSGGTERTTRRLADLGRVLVYGLLCALALTFLLTSRSTGNSDRTDQTWTAKVLEWSLGPLIVGAIGVAILVAAGVLVWRAVSGGPQDEPAVLDVAPRETRAVHLLGAAGNLARGAVLGLVGVFLLVAAITYDPNETVGLDGALKRLLDASYGPFLVGLVGIGFAAFGVASIARAWVNRGQAARPAAAT
jgi:uncharacterized protein DUF1206